MKDVIAFIFMYLIWNSPVHNSHPTLIPVLITLYFVYVLIEIIIVFIKNK